MRVSSNAPALPAPIDREAIEDEIQRLIGILDAIDPDPDLEPSLGWSPYNGLPNGVDLEGDEPDDEPSLGALEIISQVTWGSSACEDFELDTCDDEDGDNGIGDDGGLAEFSARAAGGVLSHA